jgi:hypothetical protein
VPEEEFVYLMKWRNMILRNFPRAHFGTDLEIEKLENHMKDDPTSLKFHSRLK